jgi:rod shape-determining protein MreD
MSLTLAAVGAVVMSLLQSTIIPYLEIGGAKPDLLLVYTVILTIVLGLDHGLTVAFVGGLTIDAIAARPLGSTAFVLLLCVARGRSASIVVAVALLGVVSPALALVVYGALRTPVPVADPFASILPDMTYSTGLAILFGPLASRLHRRYFERERIDW